MKISVTSAKMSAFVRLTFVPKIMFKHNKASMFSLLNITKRYTADLIVNHKVKIDPIVKEALDDGSIKSPKKHPGLVTVRAVKLPKELSQAMEALLEKYSIKDVKVKSEELYRKLWSRKLRQPNENVRHRAEELRLFYLDKMQKKTDIESLNDDEKRGVFNKIEVQVNSRMHKETYNWEPVGYNAVKCMYYMLSRLPKEYSVLYQIFSEILKRDSDFHPRTMFDFGSGVGSAIWASQAVWPKSVYEYMCVDLSKDMNTLSRLLLQGGSEDAEMLYKGVHHLPYYPTSIPHKYDLVVSGFTFIELGTKVERLEKLLSLWEKTEKYLVLVENGTNAGFELVSEARDFLLQVSKDGRVPELVGHVFAPCPHDELCPRGLRNDGTPCNFEVKTDYLPKNLMTAEKKPIRYSYVVLKKGERDTSVAAWPRLVRPTSKPSKRVHCRTCTANAELERHVITAAKHGRELLRCARACRWGDLLPMLPNTELNDEKHPTTEGDIDAPLDENPDGDFSTEDDFPSAKNKGYEAEFLTVGDSLPEEEESLFENPPTSKKDIFMFGNKASNPQKDSLLRKVSRNVQSAGSSIANVENSSRNTYLTKDSDRGLQNSVYETTINTSSQQTCTLTANVPQSSTVEQTSYVHDPTPSFSTSETLQSDLDVLVHSKNVAEGPHQ